MPARPRPGSRAVVSRPAKRFMRAATVAVRAWSARGPAPDRLVVHEVGNRHRLLDAPVEDEREAVGEGRSRPGGVARDRIGREDLGHAGDDGLRRSQGLGWSRLQRPGEGEHRHGLHLDVVIECAGWGAGELREPNGVVRARRVHGLEPAQWTKTTRRYGLGSLDTAAMASSRVAGCWRWCSRTATTTSPVRPRPPPWGSDSRRATTTRARRAPPSLRPSSDGS